jgi:hypothetical protein
MEEYKGLMEKYAQWAAAR